MTVGSTMAMLRYNCYSKTYEYVEPSSGKRSVTVLLPRINVVPPSTAASSLSSSSSANNKLRPWRTSKVDADAGSDKPKTKELEPDYDSEEILFDVGSEDDDDDDADDGVAGVNDSYRDEPDAPVPGRRSRGEWVSSRTGSDGNKPADGDYEFESPTPTAENSPTSGKTSYSAGRGAYAASPSNSNYSSLDNSKGARKSVVIFVNGASSGQRSSGSKFSSLSPESSRRRHHHHHHHHQYHGGARNYHSLGSHEFVRATNDYVTREPTLLSFRKGDVIRIVPKNSYLEKGWLHGVVNGRSGIFPSEYVEPVSRTEAIKLSSMEFTDSVEGPAAPEDSPEKDSGPWTGSRRDGSSVDSGLNHVARSGGGSPVDGGLEMSMSSPSAAAGVGAGHSSSSSAGGGGGGGRRRSGGDDGGGGGRMGGGTSSLRDAGSPAGGMNRDSALSDDVGPTVQQDGKHSLLQFALLHFRDGDKMDIVISPDGSIQGSLKTKEMKNKRNKGKKSKDGMTEWTWREMVDMVKFTRSPIQNSLLKLESSELNRLAVECFLAVMRYMGDYPMASPGSKDPQQTEVDCVYALLRNCYNHKELRDEVYCQVMKQTTNNKSARPDSAQRGWRLFSILAAYFTCTDVLRPYLFKYLENAAYDKRRAYHGTALVCLQNLRKTFKYEGRKNVPSIEEITAITAGRNSKRQIYRLPGGTERVINTKSTTVVQDIIEEICSVLNIHNPDEMEEYSLYCIVEGDTFTVPLARNEYILDVTTELHKKQHIFYLIFCRSVWHYSLRLDNQLYIELVFNQIAPDYLEGLLLVMPGEALQQDYVYDIAKIAALLHRATDMEHLPTMKEVKFVLPKPALTIRDIKPPQWVNLVQSSWKEVVEENGITPIQAKAQVLETLEKWPLFGSSFFAVTRVANDPRERREYILALNKHGVHFLDLVTHETLIFYPFAEIISTRKSKAGDGPMLLDLKCGNLMQQKVTSIQTDQAHEIARLIRQYIAIERRTNGTRPAIAASAGGGGRKEPDGSR